MQHKVSNYLENCWYAYIFRQNSLSLVDIPNTAHSSWEIYQASRQEWQCKGYSFVKRYQNCHCTFLALFSPRSKIPRLIHGPHLPGMCCCQCNVILWLVILPIMQCLPFTTRLRIGITAHRLITVKFGNYFSGWMVSEPRDSEWLLLWGWQCAKEQFGLALCCCINQPPASISSAFHSSGPALIFTVVYALMAFTLLCPEDG